jgi:hypothetical protein
MIAYLDNILLFDGCLALLTLLGLSPNLWSFYKKDHLNPLERRLSLMTWAMALFFFLRAILNLFHFKALIGPVYTAAILIMISTALYFETLLRRHYSQWFKYYLTGGAFISVVLANTGHLTKNIESVAVFGAFVLSVQFIMLGFALFRDRSQYTRIENSMIFTGSLTLIFLAPMFLSDVTTFKWPIPKLGVLAALIFSYVSLFDQNLTQNIFYPLKKLFYSGVVALLLCVPFVFIIESRELWFWSRLYMALFGFGISFRIFIAVSHLNLKTETGAFMETLNAADKSSVIKFLLGFKDFYKKVSIQIVRPDFLKNYDSIGIEKFMESHRLCLLSRDQIQIYQDSENITSTEKGLLDQISVLLETTEMTHLMKIGVGDVYYVLLGVPLVQYQKMVELQAQAISQTALLIQDRQKAYKTV